MKKNPAALDSLLNALAKQAANVLLENPESSHFVGTGTGASSDPQNLRARTYRAVSANKLLSAIGELQKILQEQDTNSAVWTTIAMMKVALNSEFAEYIPSIDITTSSIDDHNDGKQDRNDLSETERCIRYQQTVEDVLKEHPRWTITAARQKAARRLDVDPQTIIKFTYDPRDKQVGF